MKEKGHGGIFEVQQTRWRDKLGTMFDALQNAITKAPLEYVRTVKVVKVAGLSGAQFML